MLSAAAAESRDENTWDFMLEAMEQG